MKRVSILVLLAGLVAITLTGCATKPVSCTPGQNLAYCATQSPVSWQHPEVGWTLNLPSENP